MKRWMPWFAIPAIFSIWVMLKHAAGSLLTDTDTAVLLSNIRERNNPMSWFAGDWPLFNHFYRPISTLPFELDNALYGNNAAGYGLTNAIICAICICAAFWFFREFTDNAPTTGAATALFGLAHITIEPLRFLGSLFWILPFVALFGFTRGKFKEKLPSVLIAFFVCMLITQILPNTPLDFKNRIVDWLPGRTASTMTIFALVALASYTRFERLTSARKPQPLTPYDVPATKSTVVVSPGRAPWVWVIVAAIATALALGAYEQAIMIPALITGICITFALSHRKPHWANLAIFWGLLIVYILVRRQLVPSDVSGYQAQQFRSGIGVLLDLTNYLFPVGTQIPTLVSTMELGVMALIAGSPFVIVSLLTGNVLALKEAFQSRTKWILYASLLMGFFAFLPMAWLKFFSHYHYFPAVFYSLFVVLMIQVAFRTLRAALSPPPIDANQLPA